MSEAVAVLGVRNTTDAVEVDVGDGVVARFHPISPGGRRHLLGCYLDIDDLHSRISVLSRPPH